MTSSTGIGSTIRTILVVASLGFGVFAALATIAGFFGTMWWGFDLMANLRWQLAWTSLLCAVVYALSAQGIATFVFIGAVVVNGFVLAPAWTGSQPAGTGEDGAFVVSLDLTDTTDTEQALRWLFDTDADVLLLAGTTIEKVEPLTVEGSPYQILVSPPAGRTGITIIAQRPYAVETLTTDGTAESVYVVSVAAGGDVVSVVTASGELATSGMEADALTARLDTVRSVVDNRTGPVMVMGNLGATVHASGMRSLIGETGLRDATEGSGYKSTWPASDLPVIGGWIGIPIDIVLMTPDITPLEFATGPGVGANHLPVSVTVGPAFQG